MKNLTAMAAFVAAPLAACTSATASANIRHFHGDFDVKACIEGNPQTVGAPVNDKAEIAAVNDKAEIAAVGTADTAAVGTAITTDRQ